MRGFAGWVGADADAPAFDSRPAAERCDGVSVLYSGYIANTAELREESNRRGQVLREATPAQLFASAYRWWGEELQTRVLGEYAVALFDPETRNLFLTHDALGLVPLFYSQGPHGFAFGSHLEDLLPLTGTDSLDEEYIADYLATCTVISARTPYSQIRRLLPGESVVWCNRRVRVRKTWDISRVPPVRLASDEEYEERLRLLLRQGVTAALQSEGKVWSELSGGLDSSSVVSMAAHSAARRLETLSLIYTSSISADESAWMKTIVRHYDLPWHTLDAAESMPFSELPDTFFAEPLYARPTAGLFRRYRALAQSHGVKVILTGYGGDQVFCGDSPRPYFLADFLPFHLCRMFAALRLWQTNDPDRRSVSYHLLKNVLLPYLRYCTGRSLGSPEAMIPPPWADRDYLRSMRLDRRSACQLVPGSHSPGQQYMAERIWKIGFTEGSESNLPFEFRHPLLYRPLVEFMLAIPWEQKLRPGEDRSLQRRALKGILPEPIRQRRDKAGPEEAYFEGLRNRSPWTELLLTRPRVVERGYVDGDRWRETVNQARFGRVVSMRHFIATATMEIWLRQLEDVRHATRATVPECDRAGEPVFARNRQGAFRPAS